MVLPRLYLSGPITGYPDLNFPAFRQAAVQLRRFGYTVISPIELKLPCGCVGPNDECPSPHGWQDYMRTDIIAMMVHADAVATLPEREGFPRSRGRKAELDLARALEWRVLSVSEWLQQVWFPELRPGQSLPAAVPFPG